MQLYDTIVIGGGIAGMTAALRLKRQNRKVLVLEKQDQAGGNIKTMSQNGSRMETGPHSFMGSSEYTWKLVDELNMQESAEPASSTSKNRYIYRHNKLKPLPLGFGSFLFTTLLSPIAKLRLMMEPFIPNGAKELDTAWDFFVRRFGKEAATYIMTPFISGVYAGDVNMLGARAAFAKFWNFEKESGSMILGAFKYIKAKRKRLKQEGVKTKRGLFSFDGGLGTLTTRLAKELGDDLVTGTTVTGIQHKDGIYRVESENGAWQGYSLVIATPPTVTGPLMMPLAPEVTPLLEGIPMSPVAMIHWRVKDPDHQYPDGFGFLMPRNLNLRVLGTLFPSKLFKNRTPEGWQLFATFYGGMTDTGAMNLDDSELTELMLKEHRGIFKQELDGVEILKILRYPGAIPQLLPSHPETMQHVHEILNRDTPGLFLAGNYLTGVGIEHAVESGFRAARQGEAFLASQNPMKTQK